MHQFGTIFSKLINYLLVTFANVESPFSMAHCIPSLACLLAYWLHWRHYTLDAYLLHGALYPIPFRLSPYGTCDMESSFLFLVTKLRCSKFLEVPEPRFPDVLFSRAQWSRITKNPDLSIGLLARPFARLLAPLTCSLAPPCLLCSRAPLHSLVRSLAHSLPHS